MCARPGLATFLFIPISTEVWTNDQNPLSEKDKPKIMDLSACNFGTLSCRRINNDWRWYAIKMMLLIFICINIIMNITCYDGCIWFDHTVNIIRPKSRCRRTVREFPIDLIMGWYVWNILRVVVCACACVRVRCVFMCAIQIYLLPRHLFVSYRSHP